MTVEPYQITAIAAIIAAVLGALAKYLFDSYSEKKKKGFSAIKLHSFPICRRENLHEDIQKEITINCRTVTYPSLYYHSIVLESTEGIKKCEFFFNARIRASKVEPSAVPVKIYENEPEKAEFLFSPPITGSINFHFVLLTDKEPTEEKVNVWNKDDSPLLQLKKRSSILPDDIKQYIVFLFPYFILLYILLPEVLNPSLLRPALAILILVIAVPFLRIALRVSKRLYEERFMLSSTVEPIEPDRTKNLKERLLDAEPGIRNTFKQAFSSRVYRTAGRVLGAGTKFTLNKEDYPKLMVILSSEGFVKKLDDDNWKVICDIPDPAEIFNDHTKGSNR